MNGRSVSDHIVTWWFAKEIPAINNSRTMKRPRSRETPCPRVLYYGKKVTATARFLLVANLVQWLSIDRPSIMGEDRGGPLVGNFYGFNVPVPLIENTLHTLCARHSAFFDLTRIFLLLEFEDLNRRIRNEMIESD